MCEVEEGVCVPFAVHANLTLNVSEGISPGCQGVFHLSGLIHSQYPEVEHHSLGRVFSVRKCTPLESRTTHPYMLLDGEWCHMLLTGLICMGTCRWSDSGHMQVT